MTGHYGWIRVHLWVVVVICLSLAGYVRGDADPSGPSDADPPSELLICARAPLKAFRFLTVGEAVLWRADCRVAWPAGKEQPMVLDFRYEREIPARAFREAADHYLQVNGVDIDKHVRQFNQAYLDVKVGDVYRLIWDRREGLRLQLSGQFLARLPPESGWAYFTIWLGREPFSAVLRDALLP